MAGLVWHTWSLFLFDPPLAFSIASSALVPRPFYLIYLSFLPAGYSIGNRVYAIRSLAEQLVVA